MRGIAALLVVMWHASRYFGPYGTGWAGATFGPFSTLGVDLFFLISGFIMVVTTQACDGSWGCAIRFLIRRFSRIWPPYFAATVLLVALFPSPGGIKHFIQGVLFIPSAAGGVVPPVFDFPPLAVGWTLNYEMYFYAFFGISLAFGRFRWIAFSGWLLVSLVALPHFLSPDVRLSVRPSTSYGLNGYLGLMVNPIILLFVAGCAVGVIWQTRLNLGRPLVAYGAVVMAIGAVVFQYCIRFRIEHGISQWGLTLVPLLLVTVLATKTVRMNLPFGLVYLGEISYSLYLLHPLVQVGFDHAINYFGYGSPAGWAPFAVTTAGSVAIAAISHRYVEIKLTKSVRSAILRITRSVASVPAAIEAA
jgi:peptidoglycan/LPS O-acetylase OafA/YrhL